jgi:hypothetical protein
LEDENGRYFCTELDLGDPAVRDVTNNRPGRDGIDDRTRLAGARPITADIAGRPGGQMTADQIATLFAPFMLPALRPRLHYVLDRPGLPERYATVRKAGYTWPITGKTARAVHLAWVAADPWFYDAAERTATAWAGAGGLPAGRTYPLSFNRTYPAGGGIAPTVGLIDPAGDQWPALTLRIYGPITTPVVTFGGTATANVTFVAGFTIPAGTWVDVDCEAATAVRSDGTDVMAQLDWFVTRWPEIPPNVGPAWMALAGSSTTGISQVVASWHDRYLT